MRTTLVLALAGCATAYQPKGFSGGYSEQNLGNGRWAVTFDGNGFTSESTVTTYSHRRASELCPSGYDVIDANRDTSYHSASFDGGKTTTTTTAKPGAVLIVQCRGVAPRGHWCTLRVDGEGVCAPQPGTCEVFRDKLNRSLCTTTEPCAPQYLGCIPRGSAICAPTGCFATPATCAEYERRAKRDGSACAVR